MRRNVVKLNRIEHNEPITKEAHYEFLHNLQSALLLSLREQGELNPMQYIHAQEKLQKQRWEHARKMQDKG